LRLLLTVPAGRGGAA